VIRHQRLGPPSRDYRIDERLMVRRLHRSSGVFNTAFGHRVAFFPFAGAKVRADQRQLQVCAFVRGTRPYACAMKSMVSTILQGQSDRPSIYNIPTEANQIDTAALAEGAFRVRQDPEADPNA
jgi:hypothetical protein